VEGRAEGLSGEEMVDELLGGDADGRVDGERVDADAVLGEVGAEGVGRGGGCDDEGDAGVGSTNTSLCIPSSVSKNDLVLAHSLNGALIWIR
jgi:hypothetical protein